MSEEIRTVTDITGVELTHYHPDICNGNGETLDERGNLIECCCDECDYYLGCFASEGETRHSSEK